MKNNSVFTIIILAVGFITYEILHYSPTVFSALSMSFLPWLDLGTSTILTLKVFSYLFFLLLTVLILKRTFIPTINPAKEDTKTAMSWPNFKVFALYGFTGVSLHIAHLFTSKLESEQLFKYHERNQLEEYTFFMRYSSIDSILYIVCNIGLIHFFVYFLFYLKKKEDSKSLK